MAEPKIAKTKPAASTTRAVIKTGGKQYIVAPNQELEVELLAGDKKLELGPLLVISGDKVQVGQPLVSGVKVKAEVVEQVKGDKLKVLKYKPKKRYHKLTGHRQQLTKIKITAIS